METSQEPLKNAEPEQKHKPEPEHKLEPKPELEKDLELPKDTKHILPHKTLEMKAPLSQPQSQSPKSQESHHTQKPEQNRDNSSPTKQEVPPTAFALNEEFKGDQLLSEEAHTPSDNDEYAKGELSEGVQGVEEVEEESW